MPTASSYFSRTTPAPTFDLGPWGKLADSIRLYDADVVVLVARKMPRLVEVLHLDLGKRATFVSDQAVPFVARELEGARVAIIDDVWNVGTTMLNALKRVRETNPRSIRLFALAAKDADRARNAGVHLTIESSLGTDQRRALVEAVPKVLRLSAKPYDMDFPIIPCHLRAPFGAWSDCWHWLTDSFGDRVHSTVDDEQVEAGFARATIDIDSYPGWVVKARLYFDLNRLTCNLVPMALAPSIPRSNVYPEGTLATKVFEALSACLSRVATTKSEPFVSGDEEGDGLSRINTYCDALLFSDMIYAQLRPLLQRDHAAPLSVPDLQIQFGPAATERCLGSFALDMRTLSQVELFQVCHSRQPPDAGYSVLQAAAVTERAGTYLRQGFATLALDALINDLALAVGADDPDQYSLGYPYSRAEIQADPYLRLRIGFTYDEIVNFFRANLDRALLGRRSIDSIVSALMDAFIDRGAIVPTFNLTGKSRARIYRKGEANPRWDEEVNRLVLAIESLPEKDRKAVLDTGRTRVAKIASIMALSKASPTSLRVAPLERGSTAMLPSSVVEKHDVELTKLVLQRGLWK